MEMRTEFEEYEIDLDNLTGDLKDLGSYYSYYSVRLAKEQERSMDAASDLGKKKDNLYMEIRNDYIERGEKVTEKLLESCINKNDKFKVLQSINVDIDKKVLGLKAIMKILEHRTKILENMSSNKRKEIDSGVHV